MRKRLASGEAREYHYAWRGGPRFWDSASGITAGSAEYLAALAEAAAARKAAHARGLMRGLIIAYLSSPEFAALSPRYQSDIKTSVAHPRNGIEAKFGDHPIRVFNDPRIRPKVIRWRDSIGGKVGDVRKDHLVKIVTWAVDRGEISEHRLKGIRGVYRSNRSEVIWTEDEIAAFVSGAAPHVGRILIAATETGLRPEDLHQLTRFHIHHTPRGRRITITTRKRGRLVSIPVTPAMAALIDATPNGQSVLLATASGDPYRHENYLGDAVSAARDRLGLRKELRLYDARGTAVTRLLAADASLREIATAMGWSYAHAATMLETYAAMLPEKTDDLAEKIERARNESANRRANR